MRAILFLTMVCLVMALLLETANSNDTKKDKKKGAVAAHGKGKDAHKGASSAKGNKKDSKSPAKKDAKGKKDKKEKPEAKKGKGAATPKKDKKSENAKASPAKGKKTPTKPKVASKAVVPKAEPAQNEPSSAPVETEQDGDDGIDTVNDIGAAEDAADNGDLAEDELLEDYGISGDEDGQINEPTN
uniref:1106 effector family protein variant 1 n=1 Tax=Heterodera avenae TaxID=34510 RepID=A0A7S5UK65_HETAV|nr:1106 effector family protein variant 1 [Heterodera avenae]